MHTYIIEAAWLPTFNYRIVASFQTDDDEKAIHTYCKFRRAGEARDNREQSFAMRKFVPTADLYLDGVQVMNLEVLFWGDEDISDIVVPEVSPVLVTP